MRRTCLAILTALTLGAALRAQVGEALQDRVQAALYRARPALMAHLRGATVGPERAGALALLCLAALHDGVPADDPDFAAALKKLARMETGQTYDLALRMMVFAEHTQFPDHRTLVRRDLKRLVRNVHSGAFGYTPGSGSWDLSNTQYGALGMRAAASLNMEIPQRYWRNLLKTVMRAQTRDGGFSYVGARDGAYPSMTVAGIAVMQICRQALPGRAFKRRDLDEHLTAGWRWMEKNVESVGDREARWSYYFHYGLERAAILSDVAKIGEVDWYEEGAQMLIAEQRTEGGWTSRTDSAGFPAKGEQGQSVATAFAVLFLRRKFTKVAGPITGARGPQLEDLQEQSSAEEVREVARGLWSRGRRAIPDVLEGMKSEIGARRRAAALAVYRIAGDDFGFNPHRGAEKNAEAIRLVEEWAKKGR